MGMDTLRTPMKSSFAPLVTMVTQMDYLVSLFVSLPPCQLLMSRDLHTRFSLLQPDREKSVADKQALQKSAHDRCAHSRDWIVGDRVMARYLRPGPNWVPSTIVEVLGPFTYVKRQSKVNAGNGMQIS